MSAWAVLLAVLALLAAQRVAELLHARGNARRLEAQGARFVADDGFGAILAVHVLVFVALPAEAWLTGMAFGWWTIAGGALFATGQFLRYHAITHLGPRWSTRVYVLDAPLVTSGLYRRIRHPNYLGVSLELAGLPIAFGLWRSALALTLLNALALGRRIRREEQALGMA